MPRPSTTPRPLRHVGVASRLLRGLLGSARLQRAALLMDGGPDLHETTRLALVADVHAGIPLWRAQVQATLDALKNERLDGIVLLGDLIHNDPDYLPEVLAAYGSLGVPVHAVPGNHDRAHVGREQWRRSLRHHGVTDLAALGSLALPTGLWLCGVDSEVGLEMSRRAPCKASAHRPVDAPAVLMLHDPSQLLRAPPPSVMAAFAGHTHGGQFRLPGFGPLAYPTRYPLRHMYGWARLQGVPVYTSRGVGTGHVPVRLFCPPELPILTVRPSTSEDMGRIHGLPVRMGGEEPRRSTIMGLFPLP